MSNAARDSRLESPPKSEAPLTRFSEQLVGVLDALGSGREQGHFRAGERVRKGFEALEEAQLTVVTQRYHNSIPNRSGESLSDFAFHLEEVFQIGGRASVKLVHHKEKNKLILTYADHLEPAATYGMKKNQSVVFQDGTEQAALRENTTAALRTALPPYDSSYSSRNAGVYGGVGLGFSRKRDRVRVYSNLFSGTMDATPSQSVSVTERILSPLLSRF